MGELVLSDFSPLDLALLTGVVFFRYCRLFLLEHPDIRIAPTVGTGFLCFPRHTHISTWCSPFDSRSPARRSDLGPVQAPVRRPQYHRDVGDRIEAPLLPTHLETSETR